MQDEIVICEGVSKVYRTGTVEVQALTDVDLRIRRGEFTTLIGPSGSGKSTLLNLIGGLDRPTAGHIRVDGRPIDELSPAELANLRLDRIGFVFQAYNLVPVLTARENVELIMELQGEGASRAQPRRRRCCPRSDSATSPIAGPRPSPAGSSSASPWRAPSCPGRPSCWPTSRRPTSTPTPPQTCCGR